MPNIAPAGPGRLRRYGGYAARAAGAGVRGVYSGSKALASGLRKFDPVLNKMVSPAVRMANSRFAPGFGTMAAVGFSGFAAMSSYDPTKHESRVHETLKNVVSNDVLTLGASALAARINPLLGVAVFAAEVMGVGVSSLAQQNMGAMGAKFDQARHGGRTPIQQNQNTMRATSQNLSLLGQAGYGGNEIINPQSFGARKRGLLGSEAMLMHN